MAQTVIGMFDNAGEADRAVKELTSKGFSSDNIDVANSDSNAATSNNTDVEEESGITRFFKNLFSNKEETDKYVRVAKSSQSLVTVHAKTVDEATEAANILDECGAVNVDERSRATTSDYSVLKPTTTATSFDSNVGHNSGAKSTATSDNNNAESKARTTTIPLAGKNPEIGKREILAGGSRIRSRIIDRPLEESMRLKEETVRVNKNLNEKPKTNTEQSGFSAREIEMTETSEVPIVTKEARVVEEVTVNTEVNEKIETISDTVRKTEIDIDDYGKNREGK